MPSKKKQARQMEFPGNQKLSVTEVTFDVIHENWAEYKLSDGTLLRVKNAIARIFLEVDENGNIIYNENGEPNVVVVGNQMIVPVSEGGN